MEKNEQNIKITILGQTESGKSQLIYRFIHYNSPQEDDPTIEDRYHTCINIEGKDYEIEILDTASEEDFQNMMDMWISFGDGFMLIFAINDKETFKKIKMKRDRVLLGKKGVKYPMILVGNKQDLENERQVLYEEAKDLADSWEISYIETSAKTNFNCKEAFEILAKDIIKFRNELKNKKKKCIIV